MTFNINQDLPLKYVLQAYASLPNYPTKDDFVFDILSYLVKVHESKNKDLDSSQIKFSTKTLNYIFGDKLKTDFLEKIKIIIKDLLEDGTLAKTGEFLIVKESEFLKYYTPQK